MRDVAVDLYARWGVYIYIYIHIYIYIYIVCEMCISLVMGTFTKDHDEGNDNSYTRASFSAETRSREDVMFVTEHSTCTMREPSC